MNLRLAILLPAKINRLAATAGEKLSKQYRQKKFFLVDGKKLIFHITLFQIKDVGMAVLEKFFKPIKQFALFKHPLKLSLSGLECTKDRGLWVALNIKDNRKLTLFRKNLARHLKKSGLKIEIGNPYKPHVTLLKFAKADRKVVRELESQKSPTTSFTPLKFALCIDNQYAQVTKVIRSFKLN